MYFARLLVILACGIACGGQAENWPQFRGPTGQGISTENSLPIQWSAESNAVWKVAIPAEGWSSPIVWGDRVFLTGTRESGARCHLLCLDRTSGRLLWDKEVLEQVPLRKEGKNSYATPTPCTDGKRVYAAFADGSLVAVTFTGEVAWTNREVSFYSRHGLGSSPILYGGTVIMAFDGSNRVKVAGTYPNNTDKERLGWQIPWDGAFLAAFDTAGGKRVWTGKRGKSRIAHATPVVLHGKNGDQLLSPAGDVVQAFDPKSGERLWSVYCQGEGLVPSPVAGEQLAFTSSGFEKTTFRGIRLGGKGDVTATHIAWEQKKGVPTQASPIYVKPHVFVVNDAGIATCYNEDSGDIVWQERLGGSYSPSPVFADGRIYFLSEAGETVVIPAGSRFGILARNPLKEKCQASPAISQGRIYIRSDKHLFCIGSH
jgi:outer membrane protein assembly factor BamB